MLKDTIAIKICVWDHLGRRIGYCTLSLDLSDRLPHPLLPSVKGST